MILQFQQGGAAMPPLVSYLPVTITPSSGGAKTAAASSEADLTDKDLLKMLEKLDGLPSDIQTLTKSLLNFYLDLQYGLGLNSSSITSRYLSALSQMKIANANKQMYDEAFKIVKDNGGLNEVAINDRGLLLCMNAEGDCKLFTVNEVKDLKEYRPLTNSELLNLRANSTKMAYNNNITNFVSNGIGMPAINKMVQDIITKLGSTERSAEGYSARLNNQIIKGIELLLQAAQAGIIDGNVSNMSLDGLYKNKLLDKNQTTQAAQALSYIMQTLPENAKTLLKVKSDGTAEGAQKLLMGLVTSTLDSKLEFGIDFLKDLDIDGNKLVTKTEKDKLTYTPALLFLLDKGTETTLTLNAGTSDSLMIQANLVPGLTKEGKSLGVTTLDKVANDSVFGGIFDFSHVTAGNQLVDMNSLRDISVNANQLYKVYLPVDIEKLQDGIITPNLDYLKKLELVRNEIKATDAVSPEDINAIYEKYNLPQFVDANGKVNELYYRPFGVMNATALSDAFATDTNFDSIYFEEEKDENNINSAFKTIKGTDTKEDFDAKGFFNFFGLGAYQQMLKTLVYLPLISIDPTLGAYSGGDTLTETQLRTNKQAMQENERRKTFVSQGQL